MFQNIIGECSLIAFPLLGHITINVTYATLRNTEQIDGKGQTKNKHKLTQQIVFVICAYKSFY